MNISALAAAVGLVAASAASADAKAFSRPSAQTPPIVLHAGGLIDVARGVRVDDVLVVITGDRITAVGPTRNVTVPPGARRIELGNATLLPGLIDLHVHLTLAGTAEANAKATLLAGFTTVQDLGAVNYRNLELRDAIAAGKTAGPRVIASGPWIGLSGGICDFGGIGVRGAAAFRERVEEEVRRGADVIKVCVSGWLADARREPTRYEISDAELQAAIDTAHRLKKRVAVHAISAAGIDAAVRLGADLVVHAGFVEPGTVATMRRRKIYLLPTLFSFSRAQPPDDVAALRSHLRGAVNSGLPIAYGTDAGVIAHGRNAREFEFLQDLGLQPLEVVRAATIHAAAAVGMTGRIGVVERGASADVIALDGDPLRDLSAFQRVTFVMARGVVIKRTQERHAN